MLHADIQGSETELVELLISTEKIKTIKTVFIATHSQAIHEEVKQTLIENNFTVSFDCPHQGRFHYEHENTQKIGHFGNDGFLIAYNNFYKSTDL